jgi:hypothetical protein
MIQYLTRVIFLSCWSLLIIPNVNGNAINFELPKDSIKRNAIVFLASAAPEQVSGPFSLLYERQFGKKGQTAFSFGFTPYFTDDDRFQYFTFPVALTIITFPQRSSHFEFGLSLLFAKTYGIFGLHGWNIPLMYRYQNKSRFFVAAGIHLIPFGLYPSPTLKAGFRF